jgi:hypothetical protein
MIWPGSSAGDPESPETFAGVFARVRYGRATAPLTFRSAPPGLIGRLTFRQALPGDGAALMSFEAWVDAAFADQAVADFPASRTVRADLLGIMLPVAGSRYEAPAT